MKTMFQIYDQNGDKVLEPYHERRSAQYMVDNYFNGCTIIEVEVFRDEK